jgi:hypothetical protein
MYHGHNSMGTKGQQAQVANPELLAFADSCGPVPQGIEEPITNRPVVGWIPTRSTRLISPVRSANYFRGLASGLHQRQDCSDPLSFWTQLPEESKVQIDLPQLPDRNGAVQVPAVRQAVL